MTIINIITKMMMTIATQIRSDASAKTDFVSLTKKKKKDLQL